MTEILEKEKLPFCACGCGNRVTKKGNKYIRGHNTIVNNPMERLDVRIKTSETVKKLWVDEKYRENQNTGQLKRWSKPEEHDKLSKALIKRHRENPISDDQRKILSIIQTKKWLDLEYRDKQIKLIKIAVNDLGYRKKRSDISKNLWLNSEFREKQLNGIIKYWEDQNSHNKLSKIITELWKDEEYRETMSVSQQNRWNDIDQHILMSCAQQHISIENWGGFLTHQQYCDKFNEECKELNRDKYNRECFICGKLESENVTKSGKNCKLSVHHVDMNKNQGCDNTEWRLVPVCLNCHRSLHTELWKDRIIWLLNNV